MLESVPAQSSAIGMQMSLRSGICFCWVGFIPFKGLPLLQVPQCQQRLWEVPAAAALSPAGLQCATRAQRPCTVIKLLLFFQDFDSEKFITQKEQLGWELRQKQHFSPKAMANVWRLMPSPLHHPGEQMRTHLLPSVLS